MAGHSKWAQIKHKKASADAKRGKLFTKKDFHPAMLRVNYELFDDDVVDHYLDGKINPRKVTLKKLETHRREPS